jgi:hypothetical protein
MVELVGVETLYQVYKLQKLFPGHPLLGPCETYFHVITRKNTLAPSLRLKPQKPLPDAVNVSAMFAEAVLLFLGEAPHLRAAAYTELSSAAKQCQW